MRILIFLFAILTVGKAHAQSDMVEAESKHFIFYSEKRDSILTHDGLYALEKAYENIGKALGAYPNEKILVEIYRTKEDFSIGSTLSIETLDRSGAIGICKFNKLMILTPEALAFGYRWQDTLAHEYTHYLINLVSGGKCPLWLHEGTAKYLETLWRLNVPEYLSPGNRTELVRALKDGKLIPFSRMEPSMVYLESQNEVRLAFSQVAHAVHTITYLKGRSAIRDILLELDHGKSREEAFSRVLEMPGEEFESNWQKFLSDENLAESPGAAPDMIKIGSAGDETQDFTSVDIRGHIRLGDRLRERGQIDAALIQYQKAIGKEPYNPVALTKKARTLMALGRKEEAVLALENAVAQNPNFASVYTLYGDVYIGSEAWEKARWAYEEANALNPFNPVVHEKLVLIFTKLGNLTEAEREKEVLKKLD